jgi:hypothetical protein
MSEAGRHAPKYLPDRQEVPQKRAGAGRLLDGPGRHDQGSSEGRRAARGGGSGVSSMRARWWWLASAVWLAVGCDLSTMGRPLAADRPADALPSLPGNAPADGGGAPGAAPGGTTYGVVDAGGAPGAGATWTRIYTTLFANLSYPSNCTGAPCHTPGTQKGIDLGTQDVGYRTLRGQIVPGSPDMSKLISVLQSGKMPEGRPKLPASDIELVRSWIAAGAPND